MKPKKKKKKKKKKKGSNEKSRTLFMAGRPTFGISLMFGSM